MTRRMSLRGFLFDAYPDPSPWVVMCHCPGCRYVAWVETRTDFTDGPRP